MAIDLGIERDDERDKDTPLGMTTDRFNELEDKIYRVLPMKFKPTRLIYAVAECCDTTAEALLMTAYFMTK